MKTTQRRETKRERIARFYDKLAQMGFSFAESETLRRAQLTLHRWAELECGDDNDWGSWAIERDENDVPFMVHHHYLHGRGKDYVSRTKIADREKGALRRVQAVIDARNARLGGAAGKSWGEHLLAYHQGDPRGCVLWIVRRADIPKLNRVEWLARNPTDKSARAFTAANARQIDSYYTRGFACCVD